MEIVQKTRKPKTNSFTSILDQILKKYNLSAKSNPSQLHAYTNKLGAMLPDWKTRKDVKEQKEKLTIKERAQYCAKTGDVWDIYLHALDLAETKNNSEKEIVAASSHLSRFRQKLAEAGVNSKVIDTYAKLPKVTRASNKIQKKHLEQGLANRPKTP
ncbi:hypothetical protein Glove_495g14 [Diversispora epigaea]|uniref:Uncharacterized protein n=1 Tax=Diversispora epigaea TaxID=1348612 RepID=A0A397GR97_9GLOM|nr:hypothetical protein Glove_495g14 [Diversispora epigaea]